MSRSCGASISSSKRWSGFSCKTFLGEGEMNLNRWMQAALLVVALAAFAFAADVTGTWSATFDTQVGTQEYTFVLKQQGTKLTGVAKSAFAKAETEITEGTVNGDEIAFIEN